MEGVFLLSDRELVVKVGAVESNVAFILFLSGFLGLSGLFGVYSFFYGSGSPKAALIFLLSAFGMAAFLLLNLRKNRIEIYEKGFQVEGIFTRRGIFYYEEIGRIEQNHTRYLGFSYANFTIYRKNGNLMTGINSFFFKDLEVKMAPILERIR